MKRGRLFIRDVQSLVDNRQSQRTYNTPRSNSSILKVFFFCQCILKRPSSLLEYCFFFTGPANRLKSTTAAKMQAARVALQKPSLQHARACLQCVRCLPQAYSFRITQLGRIQLPCIVTCRI